jgi:hypothetical protein
VLKTAVVQNKSAEQEMAQIRRLVGTGVFSLASKHTVYTFNVAKCTLK